ncbi:MAG: ATP-binding protein [Actinomycetota bacterium]|nr:ATP-binding protein [Actinomycetota bacterium]
MRQTVEVVGIVNLVLFAAVAVVCVRQWRNERAVTALWAALAFVALAWVIAAGQLLPEEPDELALKVVERIDLAILLLFPYLLYRFAVAFEPGGRPLARFIDSLSAALVTTTLLLPGLPAEGESWPWWFAVYAFAFVVHWSVLLLIVAVRLWRAGRGEASVARRRMQMLAFASTAFTAALVLALASPADDSPLALTIALLATASGIAFLLGFAPPAFLRVLWRRPEQARLQMATGELMAATSVEDVAARVLPPMASLVGARGIALVGPDGTRIAAHGAIDEAAHDVQRFEFPFGTLVLATSTFAPFFGDEERKLLTALGLFTGLALDRARLFAQERTARESLERADELKSEFVALAAHELRSPVGAIYGLSETIAERGAQLDPSQLAQLQDSLTTQIRHLRDLVEQLLDLSRLDADAVSINPQRVRVRDRLEEIARSVAPQSEQIGIEVDPALEVDVDVAALDRIVSNLVANACRYGRPPVVISADTQGGVLRVTVEDQGPGVPDEFVPQLFDRFARSAGSAATVAGTGLGLAIARSYARAHSGEVSYRHSAVGGAAFELTLPALSAA